MYTTVPGSSEHSSPIRMWADPESVEPQALEQLRNVAALPWTHGVAVMPDVHSGIGATVVDEIPGAYKDIRSVMAQQSDLVEIVAELKQVVCVKG